MSRDINQIYSRRRELIALVLKPVTVVNATLYFVVAILHLGVKVPLGVATLGLPDEPIPPATVFESLIGAGLTVAAVAMFRRSPRERQLVRGAYVFALIGTLFGMTIALLRDLPAPEIWVHIAMLAGLAVGFILLYALSRSGGPSAAGRAEGD
jgi:hypothetical protein